MLHINKHDNSHREVKPMSNLKITEHVIGVIFTQYSMKVGLSRFKEAGEETLKKELTQLHNMDVFVRSLSRIYPMSKNKKLCRL